MLECEPLFTVKPIVKIQELEARTGLGRATIRFYERQRLLGQVPRAANNYRDYPDTLVNDLKMISGMKALGFSLDEIRSVLQGIRARGMRCLDGARLLAAKRQAIHLQIRQLRQISTRLLAEQRRLEDRAQRHGQG